MRAQRQLMVVLMGVILLMAGLFGREQELKAGPPLQENSDTIIGEAVQMIFASENSDLTALEADRSAYLPLITGVNGAGLSAEAEEVVELVNAERALAGCAPLQTSSQLTAAAQGHSQDMAINDYFSHTSLDGRSPWDRIRAEGYNFRSAAENIAAGYPTPASVMEAWMNSNGHRANILNCDLEDIGVGYYYLNNDTGNVNYRHYWTQDFGSKN